MHYLLNPFQKGRIVKLRVNSEFQSRTFTDLSAYFISEGYCKNRYPASARILNQTHILSKKALPRHLQISRQPQPIKKAASPPTSSGLARMQPSQTSQPPNLVCAESETELLSGA